MFGHSSYHPGSFSPIPNTKQEIAGELLKAAIDNNNQDLVVTTLSNMKLSNLTVIPIIGMHFLTPLQYAASKGKSSIVSAILMLGAKVNFTTSKTWPALTYAIRYGFAETMLVLIEHGAGINTKIAEFSYSNYIDRIELPSCTALHVAALYGYDEIIDILNQKGAFIDEISGNNNLPTSLFLASYIGHTKALTKLLECGANVNFCNDEGETSLFIAVKREQYDIVKILLDSGADPFHKNKNKQTADMFCKNQKMLDLYKNHSTINFSLVERHFLLIKKITAKQLENTDNNNVIKQQYCDLIMTNIVDFMQIIQHNTNQFDHFNILPSMLFEFANLINAINQENSLILNQASAANRNAAGEFRHSLALSIRQNFKTENVNGTPDETVSAVSRYGH